MFGKLNSEEIEELLGQQVLGRIGCHAEGLTYIVPISYAYDGSYVYCHAFEGMKLDMMRKNPGVCFEVDNTKNLSNWQSVVAWGDFEELPTGVLRENGLKILQERKLPIISSETMQLGSHWPFTSAFKEDIGGVVFRIHLQEKTGRYEKTAIESSFVR